MHLTRFIKPAAMLVIASTVQMFAIPQATLAQIKQQQHPVMLIAGEDATHGHASKDFIIENLTLSDPFAYATLPNSPVAGGFLALTNSGSDDDRLIAGSSDIAGEVQIHEMKMENDVMKMREVDGGLVAPAGETVALEPGGYHIMFMKLKQPLVEGDVVNVTLTFEKSGDIEIQMPVRARPKRGNKKHGHDMKKGH